MRRPGSHFFGSSWARKLEAETHVLYPIPIGTGAVNVFLAPFRFHKRFFAALINALFGEREHCRVPLTETNDRSAIAYIGARLPTLSETFVSNELLAVRAAGLKVLPASVFPPRAEGMDRHLHALASEAIVVYSATGFRNAAAEFLVRPLRSLRTLGTAVRDGIVSRDATLRARSRLPVQVVAALGLARRLRSAGVGHIHAHMANTPTTIAMYAAAQLGVGFSFTGHANDLFVHRAFLPEKLRRAAFVACISRWHRGFYRRFADVPEDRLPVIRCGVDTESLGSTVQDVPPRVGPVRILSVGRLVAKKGMDTLIRAIAELGPAMPVHCEIIGDGPQRAELSSLAAALGVGDCVELLGARPNVEVLERVRACDAFVLACRRDTVTGDQDGIPVSLMEAMAAGRCVVTSSLPPITELVIDGQTGICVPEGDANALAAALRRVAAESGLRESLGRSAREHVAREFDRKINTERLAGHFQAALGAREHGMHHPVMTAAPTT